MADVAYKPFETGSFSPTKSESEIKNIPPYEDLGVKYRGYAKKLEGSNIYQLIKQDPFYYSYDKNFTAITGSLTLGFSQWNNRKFYLTELSIDYYETAAITDGIQIDDNQGNAFCKFIITQGVNSRIYSFSTPILIEKSTIKISFNTNAAIGNKLRMNVVGFLE